MKNKYKSINGHQISCPMCKYDEFDESSIIVTKDNGMCSNESKYIKALECLNCSYILLFDSVQREGR